MTFRSHPFLLIYEGVLQKAICIIASDPFPGIKFYALTDTNKVVELGELVTCRIDLTGMRLAVIWYEYDTAINRGPLSQMIHLIMDGAYGLRDDSRSN